MQMQLREQAIHTRQQLQLAQVQHRLRQMHQLELRLLLQQVQFQQVTQMI